MKLKFYGKIEQKYEFKEKKAQYKISNCQRGDGTCIF